MKNTLLSLSLLMASTGATAQSVSCASYLKPQPKSDVTIPYRYTDEGTPTPLQWGLDLAWLSEDNVRTGVLYAGKELIDIVRLSFQPTSKVDEGTWSEDQKADLKERADITLRWLSRNVAYNLNDDHKSVDSWYNLGSIGSTGRGQRWAKLIDMAYDYYKSRGLTNLVSISPYNEPDFGWDQGYSNSTRKADFKAIINSLRNDYGNKYDGVRMCGGNTLNDDKALEWWSYLKDVLQEGNTHQLAGSFDNYADFFTQVRQAGQHATADELHNVMEAMVGVEYGLQTGIWWGTCEYARSQFMKATHHANPGERLAYAEHRNNWTAASVYRQPDGGVQAFGGMSERQSYTTDYQYVALDKPVWYNGVRGRDFLMHLPGGTDYQVGQSGAEVCIDVQAGDDVMPHIGAGTYKLLNVNSGYVAGFSSAPGTGWTSLTQKKSSTLKSMQWVVTPLQETGDFSYYTFKLNTDKDLYMDILNWNYNDGANVGVYPGGGNRLEQYYLQYAGQGAFYIRSRYSNKCLEVANASTGISANVQMGDFKGGAHQQWRFIATNVTPDKVAPAAPASLEAEVQTASVSLKWEAPEDRDIMSYTILRASDDAPDVYYTIANQLTATAFVDNEAEQGHTYYYKVYAEDKSLNRGEATSAVTATLPHQDALLVRLPLEANLCDATPNANHAALLDEAAFAAKGDRTALQMNGTSQYMQLPYTVANHDAITISLWVNHTGGAQWQRIFDFGNGTEQYMFLTTNCGSGLRFAIKNGGDEQTMTTTTLTTSKWHHVVVTLGENGGRLYVDGTLKAENTAMDIRPSDIRPVLNYVGRSQFTADPMFKGYLSDLRIYNYVLSAEEVSSLTDAIEAVSIDQASPATAYDLQGRLAMLGQRGIVIKGGKKVMK